jgi:putative membrane protein
VAAAVTNEHTSTLKENGMNGLEWLKPGVVLGSILYALIGVLVFWISFVIIDKLTPYKLWEEIVEHKNVALAIVVASMCISIGLIVAAAIHG